MKLRVITLNLEHGGLSWQPIVDFLREQQADIILMQEAFNGTDPSLDPNFRTEQQLQREFPDYHFDFAPNFKNIDLPPIPTDRGNLIASRFPITSNGNIFFAGSYEDDYHDLPGNFHNCPRSLQHVTVDADGTDLHVFNMQGVWDLDGANDSPERLRMSDTIVQAIQGKPRVILGGDTNARPDTRTIRAIEAHVHNVFGTELATTFNMKRKTDPGYATAVVDMLFVGPEFRVTSRECPQVDISDHLPLVVELEY